MVHDILVESVNIYTNLEHFTSFVTNHLVYCFASLTIY